jgi:hypothetical protein
MSLKERSAPPCDSSVGRECSITVVHPEQHPLRQPSPEDLLLVSPAGPRDRRHDKSKAAQRVADRPMAVGLMRDL